MAFNLPESESQTPDGVPLGWEAPWEKPQMMVVEEREGMWVTECAFVSISRFTLPGVDMTLAFCFFRSGMNSGSRFRFRVFPGVELDITSLGVCCNEPGDGGWYSGGQSPAPCQMGANLGIGVTLPSVTNRGIELPSLCMESGSSISTMCTSCVNGSGVEVVCPLRTVGKAVRMVTSFMSSNGS